MIEEHLKSSCVDIAKDSMIFRQLTRAGILVDSIDQRISSRQDLNYQSCFQPPFLALDAHRRFVIASCKESPIFKGATTFLFKDSY